MILPSSFDEFKARITESEPAMRAFYDLMMMVSTPAQTEQPAVEPEAPATQPETPVDVPATDGPAEEGGTEAPAEGTDPAPADPAPEETAAKTRLVTATLNAYSNEHWEAGVWKFDKAAGVSIRATPENRGTFKKGVTSQFKDGTYRDIIDVHDTDGANMSIWFEGDQLDPAKVGAPFAISAHVPDDGSVPPVELVVDKEETPAPAQSSGKGFRNGRTLNFDMKLLGINIAGAEFGGSNMPGTMGKQYIYPSRKDLEKYKNEGCQFIRYPVKWDRLQRTLNGELHGPDMDQLDAMYKAADDLGLWIMLDIHSYMRRYVNGSAHLIGSSQVPSSAYANFIGRLAKWLKGRKSHFGLDIMNEPYPLQPSWPAIARQACLAYRAVDTDSFLIVEGTMWANAHGWEGKNPGLLEAMKGIEGVIYQAHCYVDSNAGGLFGNRGEQIKPNAGVVRLDDFVGWCKKNNVPGLVGEFSAPYNMPTAIRAMEEQIKYLEGNNILMTYWAGGPWWTAGAANGVEVKGAFREPISVLRKYWKKGKTTRYLGPNK